MKISIINNFIKMSLLNPKWKLVLTLFVLSFNSLGQVQNPKVFNVKSVGSQYSMDEIETAMLKADWCGMINPNSSYEINFEDGSLVEMLSKNILDAKNIVVDFECVRSADETDKATYKIAENGYIIRLVSKDTNSKFTIKY